MTLVLMATHPWGTLWDPSGNVQPGEQASFTNIDDATAVTHYADADASSPSTGPVTADANGRLMRWVAEDTYLQELPGGTILQVEATSGRTLRTVESDVAVVKEAPLNVDHFAGDIAATIALGASALKGAVYIPSGARTLAATVAVSAAGSLGLEIFGDGELTELTMANTASLIGFDVGASADRVTIRDLYIKGSTAQGAGAESHAIRFAENSNYGKVKDVRIHQPGGDGIHFAGCIAPTVSDRCFITDCGGNGISLMKATTATNHARILDNWIQSCTGNGIYAGRVEVPLLEGNTFEVNGTDSAGTGNLYMFETLYPVVSANYFEDGADFDLRYGDGGGGWSVDGSIIDNLFQASSGGAAAPINVWLEACHRTEMARNKFSSVLSAVKNLQCDSGTRGLVLRRHTFANASPTTGVTFADNRNTALVEPGNIATAPAVASAAGNVILPGGFPLVQITGSTGPITSLTAQPMGTEVVIRFPDATPPQLTDGGNLFLAGNFTATTNDTLKLVSSGDNWFEVSRSGNI